VRFGPKPLLTTEVVQKIKQLRADGATVPDIMHRTKLLAAAPAAPLATAPTRPATTKTAHESLRPQLIAGVQGRWPGPRTAE
jgi:hypothetical protein